MSPWLSPSALSIKLDQLSANWLLRKLALKSCEGPLRVLGLNMRIVRGL
jgi:hypothetical protein